MWRGMPGIVPIHYWTATAPPPPAYGEPPVSWAITRTPEWELDRTPEWSITRKPEWKMKPRGGT